MKALGIAVFSLGTMLALLAWSWVMVPTELADAADAVRELRLTRLAAAALAGAALATAGCVVQGLFRNALASPSVIGISSGALLGAQLALLFGYLGEWPVALGACAGAGFSLLLLLWLSRGLGSNAVLLIGVMLATGLGAIGALVTALSLGGWELGRAMVALGLGSLDGVGIARIVVALPLIAVGWFGAWLWRKEFDILLTGEQEAATLGVHVAQLQRWAVIWAALLTAGAVTLAGGLAFVGLVVPHVLRLFCGYSHKYLLPLAALGGGAFTMGCDMLTTFAPAGHALPTGVVTALIGAPCFMWLLRRQSAEVL